MLGDQAVATSIQIHEEQGVELRLPCHPRPITTKHLIASYDHLPLSLQPKPEPLKSGRSHAGTRMAHCIAILPSLPDSLKRKRGENPENPENPDSEAEESQEPKSDVEQDDTAVILFPPEGEVGLVRALLMGEGTGSCPSGQCESELLRPPRCLPLTFADPPDPQLCCTCSQRSLTPTPTPQPYYDHISRASAQSHCSPHSTYTTLSPPSTSCRMAALQVRRELLLSSRIRPTARCWSKGSTGRRSREKRHSGA